MSKSKTGEEMFARGGVKTNKASMKKENNKRRIITIIYSIVIMLLLVGVSFAVYNYSFLGDLNFIKNETIELEFLESTNEVINIQNAIPISDNVGMNQENYFTFQVKTKTKNSMSIGYNLKIEKLSAQSGYTLLNDDEVKVYLTDYNDNPLMKPTLVSDLDNYIVYKKYHNHTNDQEEVISKYKLRVWVDESVTGEGWDIDTKIQYLFKIGVESAENKTYKVIFNSNTDKEEIKEQYIGYDETLALEKNNFIKEGYRFIGWSTTENGAVIYQDREKVTNLSGNNESITLYAVWERAVFNVDVVVQNGVIEDSSSKQVKYEENTLFKLKPNSVDAPGVVSCTNDQIGKLIDHNLTVSNVTKDTVCTVIYNKDMTVLYNDGTLIINEMAKDRKDNISIHGTVIKEYEAMSNSNSYVMASASSLPWVNERSSIKSVDLGQEISPVSTAYWFQGNNNMITGDFTKLNTSEVIDMKSMFYQAGYNPTTFELKGLENWDTSKVTNMNRMFNYLGQKASKFYLDLSSWDTSRVTDMSVMFHQAGQNATEFKLDISNWDTSKVIDMSRMFQYTGRNATEFNLDISKWNTSKVTNMNQMFYATGDKSQEFNINLSNWNVTNVLNMESMFWHSGYNAISWTIGDLKNWDVSSVTSMKEMFDSAGYSAAEWNVGDLSKWDTSKVTNMNRMFQGAGHGSTSWNIGDIGKWDTSKVTNMSVMFQGAGHSSTSWDIGDLSSWDVSNVIDMSYMFIYAGGISETFKLMGLDNWDTSKVTTMERMFAHAGETATSWNIGNLSKWDVSNVTNMSVMFSQTAMNAEVFDIGDLSNWDTSKVTTMERMFEATGINAQTFNSIGTLNIPVGCNVNYFSYSNEDAKVGVRKLKGNLVINGSLSNYTDMLRDSATDSSARLNLYYKNAEAEAIVNELISLYGPNGSVTKGNIYKVDE